MARRAKQKFLGKKNVTGVTRTSSVVKSGLCGQALWAGATTGSERNFFCFCLTVFTCLLSPLRETAAFVYYLCCQVGLLSLLPHNADVIMSPESCACGQQCEAADPLPVELCAPAAAKCAAAHPLPILDTPAGARRGNNRLYAHLAAACW